MLVYALLRVRSRCLLGAEHWLGGEGEMREDGMIGFGQTCMGTHTTAACMLLLAAACSCLLLLASSTTKINNVEISC